MRTNVNRPSYCAFGSMRIQRCAHAPATPAPATRRTAPTDTMSRRFAETMVSYRGRLIAFDSYSRRPPGRVLPLPVFRRVLVAHDPSGSPLRAQLSSGVLRDVPEMAEEDALGHLRDGGAERFGPEDGVGEVLDVRGRVRVVAGEIEAVRDRCLAHLSDDLSLHVVVHVAVAVEHDRAGRPEDLGSAPAAQRLHAVAALSLPDDGLSTVELEDGFLSVRELPVVV